MLPDMQRALGPERHHKQITSGNLPNLQAKPEM